MSDDEDSYSNGDQDEIDPERHFKGANLKTVAKLKILEWYLDEYVRIMEKYWDEYWYIDTHAGTGKTLTNDGNLIDGSSLRVLENHWDKFERFYLYELDANNFQTLHETLSDEHNLDFEVREAIPEEADFDIARCDNPNIRIFNTDSNQGVKFLAEHANESPHWFTFIDPKGLTVRRDTLDTLIRRGSMDILLNHQTTGILRNAAEDAEHGSDAVTRTYGDEDWPSDGSPDEYVEQLKIRLENHDDWQVQTKNMTDPYDGNYRFDLVFASANDVAHRIMGYIMTNRDDLWEKANEELGQSGLGRFS